MVADLERKPPLVWLTEDAMLKPLRRLLHWWQFTTDTVVLRWQLHAKDAEIQQLQQRILVLKRNLNLLVHQLQEQQKGK